MNMLSFFIACSLIYGSLCTIIPPHTHTCSCINPFSEELQPHLGDPQVTCPKQGYCYVECDAGCGDVGPAPDFTKAVGRCTSKTACASLDSEVNKSEVVASSSNEDGQVSEVIEVKKEADVIEDNVQEIAITDIDDVIGEPGSEVIGEPEPEVIGEPEPEVSGLEDEDGGVLDEDVIDGKGEERKELDDGELDEAVVEDGDKQELIVQEKVDVEKNDLEDDYVVEVSSTLEDDADEAVVEDGDKQELIVKEKVDVEKNDLEDDDAVEVSSTVEDDADEETTVEDETEEEELEGDTDGDIEEGETDSDSDAEED